MSARRHYTGVAVAIVAVNVLCTARLLAQEQPAVFIHGLVNQSAWNNYASSCTGTGSCSGLHYSHRTRPYLPIIDWTKSWAVQAAAVNASGPLAATSGPFYVNTLIVGGYSNGAPVARKFNRDHGRNNRIVTIAGANSGAPIADSLIDGTIASWGTDLVGALFNPITFYATCDCWWFEDEGDVEAFVGLHAFNSAGRLSIWFVELALKVGVALGLANVAGAWHDVLQDLRPSSAALTHPTTGLNSSANLAREAQAMPSRAGIIARIGSVENLAFNLAGSQEAGALIAAKAAVVDVWVDAYDFFYGQTPYGSTANMNAGRWAIAPLLLNGFDGTWCSWIGAGTNCFESDGLLPVSTQQYPGGGAYQYDLTDGGDHVDAMSSAEGLSVLRTVFTQRFNVPQRVDNNDPISISVNPAAASIVHGTSQNVSATVKNRLNGVLTGAPVTWTQTNSGVASLTPNGQSVNVHGLAVGSTQVIGTTANGYADTSVVTVTNPASGPLTIEALYGTSPTSPYSSDGFSVWVTGGREPYTYMWAINYAWQPNSNEPSFWWTNSGVNFLVTVLVTDADNQQQSAEMSVYVYCQEEWCQ